MPLAFLTFFTGLAISAIAIYYSVIGLAAIFAAAVIPIIVMGTVLELSKLVAAWWLKTNWNRAPILLKSYMLVAVIVLMIITSMGIFGFLSKAHTDQAVPTGDVAAQVALIDEKIKTQRDNIETARRALAQMDSQVDQLLGRSADERGAERAVQIRRNQARERTALQNEISKAQEVIAKLNEEKSPIASKLRAVEAEVGPIKYIAKLIYGDNPDANLLEKAVTWVIIIIVFVFDPLAVLLLLASQLSFQWAREDRQKKLKEEQDAEGDSPRETTDVVDTEPPTVTVQPAPWPFKVVEETKTEPTLTIVEEPVVEDTESEKEIEQFLAEVDADDDENHLNEPDHVKAAKAAWKLDYPNDSLKHQRRLLEQGFIKTLPWDLPPYTLTAVEDEAAVEAAKWAQEQIENSKKKVTTWLEKDGPTQIKKSVEE
jgi:flagellar basal body-associated protein FliL